MQDVGFQEGGLDYRARKKQEEWRLEMHLHGYLWSQICFIVTSVLLRLVMGDMYNFLFHAYNGGMCSMNDGDERLLERIYMANQAS